MVYVISRLGANTTTNPKAFPYIPPINPNRLNERPDDLLKLIKYAITMPKQNAN